MSRETKIGFAFVFMLLVVFGFVVYKKVEHNRAQKGDLLAAVEESSSKAQQEETVPPTHDRQNPIEDNSFPPVQSGDPFPEPAPVEPASWDQQTFGPDPQFARSPSGGDGSTSINQFDPGPGNEFAQQEPTPVEPFPADHFPAKQESEPTTVTVLPTAEPSEFEPVPVPDNQDQFAQAPVPPGFEAPAQFAPEPEPAVAKSGDPGGGSFNPFPADELPAQREPSPAPAEFDNEQFSARSEPAPAQAGNPFGSVPEIESPQAAGDPFGAAPENAGADSSAPPTFEPEQIRQIEPAPTELAQPNPLPVHDAAPTEITPVDGPGFEITGGQIPQELPADSFAQLPTAQENVGFSEAPTLVPSGKETGVYVVRPGDNYWKISKAQYGTVRYFSALARFNAKRIPDAKKMRPGMKVLTPARQVLEAQYPDLFPKFAANTEGVSNVGHRAGEKAGFFLDTKGAPMYRVGQNDTLGGIAQKHLGRFSRWVEIYQLNRHRLKDPNALTVGDILQLPANASRVNMVQHASGVR